MLRTDIDQVRNLALKDPISNCFILSRLNDLSNNSWSLQNEISVFENNKVIESVVYSGANIIPLETNEESRVAFAQYLLDSPRRASSIVGDKTQVLDLWNLLKPFWNKPREIRSNQPVLVINDATRLREFRLTFTISIISYSILLYHTLGTNTGALIRIKHVIMDAQRAVMKEPFGFVKH